MPRDRAEVWCPSRDVVDQCALTRLIRSLEADGYGPFSSFEELHRWTVDNPTAFWPHLVRFLGISSEEDLGRPWEEAPGPTPLARKWFPDLSLNFAENLLAGKDDHIAIISWSEGSARQKVSRGELRKQAFAFAAYLKSLGVKPGDRVFAYLPNIPEAVVCMLGATALGATWSSCGTDYQIDGVVSRINRVEPSVLVAATSYAWRGDPVKTSDTIRQIVTATSSIKHLILVNREGETLENVQLASGKVVSEATLDSILQTPDQKVALEEFPFSHPLYVMFSSGTTGMPKAIVHSAGGTLLEHKKEHALHSDIRPGDRVFYQTSTSWMMWNWLVSALGSGATIVLYDGDPLVEDGMVLWRMADEERVTHFGTSAAFLSTIERRGIEPGRQYKFNQLRAVLSTGSTLYPSQFDFIKSAIKPVWIQSISGGTDIIGCFGLGAPIKGVIRGEVQAKSLGYDVCVYSSDGVRVVGEDGELVCANPAPSMPIHFLNDPHGDAYRSAYFSEFPGVWRHGDCVREESDGGLVFLGRSDATLKPAGVRVATADMYAALHKVAEVAQAMAVGYVPSTESLERIVLFVVMEPPYMLNESIEIRIREVLRLSNVFYAPAMIVQVPELPRTTNNKLSEMSVKKLLQGETAVNVSALANPGALDYFRREILPRVKGTLG